MRPLALVVALAACSSAPGTSNAGSSGSSLAATDPSGSSVATARPGETGSSGSTTAANGSAEPAREHKPPDAMDERMRHCPVALDGATSTVEVVPTGVRFSIDVPPAQRDEVRKRARHVVEFAAKHARAGHGEFDGKGGGRMKNCPVVTDRVTIVATDTTTGARLDVTTEADQVGELQRETRERVARFPFVGATIVIR